MIRTPYYSFSVQLKRTTFVKKKKMFFFLTFQVFYNDKSQIKILLLLVVAFQSNTNKCFGIE